MQIKKLLITLVVIAVILFIVSSIFVKAPAVTIKKNPTPVVVATTTVTVQSLTYATTSGTILIEYPVFSNMPALNSKIKKEADELFATSTKELNASVQSLIDFNVDMSTRSLVFEKKIDRDRIYINDKTKTAALIYKQYIDMGGAHGSFFYGSAVYDLRTGSALTLQDILQNYEAPIRSYVRKEIEASVSGKVTCVHCESLDGRIDSGVELLSNYFHVDSKGLTLLYGAYDLGAYAATSAGQEVIIPMNALTGLVKRVW